VEFLDSHPECILGTHNVLHYSREQKRALRITPDIKESQKFNKFDFYEFPMIVTCSLVYRNIPLTDYVTTLGNIKYIDWAIQM